MSGMIFIRWREANDMRRGQWLHIATECPKCLTIARTHIADPWDVLEQCASKEQCVPTECALCRTLYAITLRQLHAELERSRVDVERCVQAALDEVLPVRHATMLPPKPRGLLRRLSDVIWSAYYGAAEGWREP